MKVKVLKPYGLMRPGDTVEVRETVAVLLIARGVVEEVKSEQPKRKR